MLSVQVSVAYGSLALFTTIIHNVFLLYHIETFLSVFKIDKTSFWLGEIVFLLWNSFNDPLFGWLSDKGYLKKNHHSDITDVISNRITSLSRSGPLFALSFVALWFLWAYPGLQFVVCLCLYDGFMTVVDLQHNSLLADLAVSTHSRAQLNYYSSLFSAVGSVSVFLSYLAWNRERFITFQVFCLCLAVFSVTGFVVCTRILRNHYTELYPAQQLTQDWRQAEAETATASWTELRSYIGEVLKHRNFLLFAVMNLVQVFHCHFNSNFFPLFLENLLMGAVSPLGASLLLGLSFTAPHINNLYFLSLCKRFGAYRVVQFLFIVKLVLSFLILLVGSGNLALLCIFIASNRIFTEGTCKLLNLVITDLVDEDFVINKRKQAVSALVFGTSALLSKPGQTLAPLIGTWLLVLHTGHDVFQSGESTGSIKRQMGDLGDEQAKLYREGCFALLVYVPIVCGLIQLLVWSQFTLHGRRLQWVKSLRADQYSLHEI